MPGLTLGGARRRAFAAVLLVLSGTGCAAASKSFRSGIDGIPIERSLRDQLRFGNEAQAWQGMADKKVAPSDALLRHMYRGVIGLHVGEFAAGATSMDRAWAIVDDRFTKRASAGVASLLTSDAVLPYYPGRTEWLMIPYYGALHWLARGERDEAAVEARRMASILALEDEEQPPKELLGVMRYVNGALFEAAGERQDALVAYRNAAALLGRSPLDTTRAPPGYGDVIVFVEDGFVARPEPRALGVYMDGDELVALTSGDEAGRLAAAQVVQRRVWDQDFNRRGALQAGWLTYELNWSTIDALPGRGHAPAVQSVGAEVQSVSGTLSEGVRADFARDQPARLSRAIVRTAVRYAAQRAGDKAFERASKDDDDDDDKKKSGRWGGYLLGALLYGASLTSAVIDQPDLRAWQLLPDRITVARLRLPVGEHAVEVVAGDQTLPLGTVTVRDGEVTLLTQRVWP
ncbi:MAG: hypothetical protein KF709_13300 [Gemmatimonadaceae bacterium]|nr:hypothetical protein [Gemmatimonadaceae bacterium]